MAVRGKKEGYPDTYERGVRIKKPDDEAFVVVTMKRGGQLYYYHPNELFSVEALTDSSGTAVERDYYDALLYMNY